MEERQSFVRLTKIPFFFKAATKSGHLPGDQVGPMDVDPPATKPQEDQREAQESQAETREGQAATRQEVEKGEGMEAKPEAQQPGAGSAAAAAGTPPASHILRPSVAQADGGKSGIACPTKVPLYQDVAGGPIRPPPSALKRLGGRPMRGTSGTPHLLWLAPLRYNSAKTLCPPLTL